MNRRAKLILTFVVAAAVLLIGYFGVRSFINGFYEPVDPDDTTTVTINIPNGSSLGRVASILYENNLIKNGTFFKMRVDKLNKSTEIKSGDFELSKSMSMDDIIEKLTLKQSVADEETIKLVIPEGFERKLIAERIEEKGLGSAAKFLEVTEHKEGFEETFPFLKRLAEGQSLEGFLFPATYDVVPGTSEEDIAKKMLAAFEVRRAASFDGDNFNGLDLNQMITLASIVEREIKLDSERATAAGVFYNRIGIGMRLQSCATVQYILGERKAVLSIEETKTDSPYNTYINDGLPPAPIASPGMKSIEAVINPEQHDYLFFVKTGEDGSHTFTKTFEEHEKAKAGEVRQ